MPGARRANVSPERGIVTDSKTPPKEGSKHLIRFLREMPLPSMSITATQRPPNTTVVPWLATKAIKRIV